MAETSISSWTGPGLRTFTAQWADDELDTLTTDSFPDDIFNNFTLFVNTKAIEWTTANAIVMEITFKVQDDQSPPSYSELFDKVTIDSADWKGKMARVNWLMNTNGIIKPFKIQINPSSSGGGFETSGTTVIDFALKVH